MTTERILKVANKIQIKIQASPLNKTEVHDANLRENAHEMLSFLLINCDNKFLDTLEDDLHRARLFYSK